MMKTKSIIEQSIELKREIAENSALLERVEKAAETISGAFRKGHRVFFCGNGGSASDAQHLAAELSGRFYFDRPPLAAEALHVNTSYLTAVANDYSYDLVFARAVEAFCGEGDVLVGLSTSGNSRNVVNAFETAKKKNAFVIALTGKGGGEMGKRSDILIDVPSGDTPRIQEAHIMIGHIICQLVEESLFGKGEGK